jgi:hypothetical protein
MAQAAILQIVPTGSPTFVSQKIVTKNHHWDAFPAQQIHFVVGVNPA